MYQHNIMRPGMANSADIDLVR